VVPKTLKSLNDDVRDLVLCSGLNGKVKLTRHASHPIVKDSPMYVPRLYVFTNGRTVPSLQIGNTGCNRR
jgi:hypothetical protein